MVAPTGRVLPQVTYCPKKLGIKVAVSRVIPYFLKLANYFRQQCYHQFFQKFIKISLLEIET